jgi:hypothetical protein
MKEAIYLGTVNNSALGVDDVEETLLEIEIHWLASFLLSLLMGARGREGPHETLLV